MRCSADVRAAALVLALASAAAARAAPAAGELADRYGVSERTVRDLHERERLSDEDVETALSLSRATGLPLSDVVGLHRAGVPFSDIAARYRVDLDAAPGRSAGARNAPAPRPDGREEALGRRFGAAPEDVRALRERGLEWPEIERALDAASRAACPPDDILWLRRAGWSWRRIDRAVDADRRGNASKHPHGGTE